MAWGMTMGGTLIGKKGGQFGWMVSFLFFLFELLLICLIGFLSFPELKINVIATAFGLYVTCYHFNFPFATLSDSELNILWFWPSGHFLCNRYMC